MGRPKKKPPPPVTLTGPEIRAARETLGLAWGKGEPLDITELANLLRLGPASMTENVGVRRPLDVSQRTERPGN